MDAKYPHSRLILLLALAALALLTACAPGVTQVAEVPATPSVVPTDTSLPSSTPTITPSATATATATSAPTNTPTATPTDTPTTTPSPTDPPPPTQTPTPAATPTPHPNAILQFKPGFLPAAGVFSSDGKAILLFKNGQFMLVQAADGSLIAEFAVPGQVSALDLSADASRLAIGVGNEGGGTDIHVYEPATGTLLYTLVDAHAAQAYILRFSQDAKTLFSTGTDGMVKVWNVTDGKQQRSFTAQHDQVTCMAIAPNGQHIVTGSWYTDKNVIAWSPAGEEIATLTTTNPHCYLATFSPDGQWLFLHLSEKMGLYRVSDWSRQWYVNFRGDVSSVNHPAGTYLTGFAPDGRLYIANRKGTVELMDAASQQVEATLKLGPLAGLSFAPDGSLIAVVRPNGVVEVLRNGP